MLRIYCILSTVVYRLACIPAFFGCVDFAFATHRVRPQTPHDNTEQQWLLRHLKAHQWWLRSYCANWVCKKLGVSCEEVSYYKDVQVVFHTEALVHNISVCTYPQYSCILL